MASLAAASPSSFHDGLKKRSRVLSSAAESYELARVKRCRGDLRESERTGTGTDNGSLPSEDGNRDLPKYTQRHVDYFEQVKQAEIARIRTEYEQYIMKKDVEFQAFGQEMARVQQQMQQQERELQRLHGENKLLKRAVGIQNQQKEECQQENAVLKSLTTQAADHIKRLEQTNYALRVHLQTSTSASSTTSSQPPDVY